MTNATKSAVILVVTTTLALLASFGVAFTDGQRAAVIGFVAAVLGLWMRLTYKDSPKRIPDV